MYESFFGLARRPFATTADPTCYVPDDAAEAVVAAVADAARAGLGVVTVTGPDGVGKTMLSRRLGPTLGEEATVARVLGGGHPSRRSLLQSLLYELGRPHTLCGEPELRQELHETIEAAREEGRRLVFAVDDAHLLSDRLLAELARLVSDGDAATVVLIGATSLEDRLADPANDELARRVGRQLTLEPLARDAAERYVRERMTASGGDPDAAFAPDALASIAHISGGVPRAINQLADHAMLLAYVAEHPRVTASLVLDALDDLRRLPTRWNEPAAATTFETEAVTAEEEADDDWGTVYEVGAGEAEEADDDTGLEIESTADTEFADLDALPAATVTVLDDEPAAAEDGDVESAAEDDEPYEIAATAVAPEDVSEVTASQAEALEADDSPESEEVIDVAAAEEPALDLNADKDTVAASEKFDTDDATRPATVTEIDEDEVAPVTEPVAAEHESTVVAADESAEPVTAPEAITPAEEPEATEPAPTESAEVEAVALEVAQTETACLDAVIDRHAAAAGAAEETLDADATAISEEPFSATDRVERADAIEQADPPVAEDEHEETAPTEPEPIADLEPPAPAETPSAPAAPAAFDTFLEEPVEDRYARLDAAAGVATEEDDTPARPATLTEQIDRVERLVASGFSDDPEPATIPLAEAPPTVAKSPDAAIDLFTRWRRLRRRA